MYSANTSTIETESSNTFVYNANENSTLNTETKSPDYIEYIFTRHAHSCNNLKAHKSSIKSVYQRTDEFDPGLSIYGIIASLQKSNSTGTMYKSDIIYVSCLVRTWMTGILLYLPNTDELKICISPFIKEKHTETGYYTNLAFNTASIFIGSKSNKQNYSNKDNKNTSIDSGNLLTDIASQNTNTPKNYSIDGGNLPTDIASQIIKLCNFFDSLSIMNTCKDRESTFPNLGKLKNKKIRLLFPLENTKLEDKEIILETDDNLKIDLSKLMNENKDIFKYKIGKFYYLEHESLEFFFQKRRYPKNKTISEILEKYFNKQDENKSELGNTQDENKNELRNALFDNEDNEFINIYDFMKKDISKFISEFISKRIKDEKKIYVITHSDCLSTFLYNFFIHNKIEGPSVYKYKIEEQSTYKYSNNIVNVPVSGDGLEIQDINMLCSYVQKILTNNKLKSDYTRIYEFKNKENEPFGGYIFENNNAEIAKELRKIYKRSYSDIKNQNSWDLIFKVYNDPEFKMKDVMIMEGIDKPELENFISSCELQCDFGAGLYKSRNPERDTLCKNRLSGESRFKSRFTTLKKLF